MSRFVIFMGDIVSIFVVLVVAFLDWMGYISTVIPKLKSPWATYIAFFLFIISHFYQRWQFMAYHPRLDIINWNWEPIATKGYERLFVKVANWPDINTPKGDSPSTCAKIQFYKKSNGEPVFDSDIEDVRWQGTPEPQADGYRYQPYDMWAVPIEAGRTRLLYIASRSVKKPKELRKIYAHCDKAYPYEGWQAKDLVLPNQDLYIQIKLWSSGFDPKDFWFELNKGELSKIDKEPKPINSI